MTLYVWSTETLTAVACAKLDASGPVHGAAWDLTTANEFVTVGARGVTFWLVDERAEDGVELRMHDAEVPQLVTHNLGARRPEFTAASYGSVPAPRLDLALQARR